MHASIGHYAGTGAATDEVIQATRQLVTALSHTPGFVSYALLDMGDGTLASISIFESRLELDAGDRLVGAWLAEHLPSLRGMLPLPEIGEIVLQRGM
jgi:hypothetical protein